MNYAASLLQPESNPALYISSVLTLYIDLRTRPCVPTHRTRGKPAIGLHAGSLRHRRDRSVTGILAPHDSASGVPPLPRIRSLAYFQPVIEELLDNPVPDGYLQYLRFKLRSVVDKADPAAVQKTTFSDDR
jgi:hypothetical protein